jgi:hypothetical protein
MVPAILLGDAMATAAIAMMLNAKIILAMPRI